MAGRCSGDRQRKDGEIGGHNYRPRLVYCVRPHCIRVFPKMSHIIIVRPYQLSDDASCKELLRDAVSSSVGAAFRMMMFNEMTFQLMILFAAIMFIFFGLPLAVCVSVVPIVLILVYLGTYVSVAFKVTRINQENIPRAYMSNPFSCFWVAEAYEPYLMVNDPRKVRYTILTEEEFRHSNLGISLQARKIVATVGLCKSYCLDEGAWLKRLCVHRLYKESGIAECILRTAVEFAIEQGYRCVNTQMPGYDEESKEMCLKWGFEFKQMYHKRIVGSLVTLLMYELTYRNKSSSEHRSSEHYYASHDGKASLNLYE